jgi:trans-2-enoyl-CoA reductase
MPSSSIHAMCRSKIETHEISIRTSTPVAKVTLEPLSVTEVDDAITTAGGSDWSVSVEGSARVIQVDGDTWVHNTVVIPASLCDEI